ncbi:E3 ubiquitin-protein ligase MARCHF2-like [Homalodisca vitripennis]|uniref:E3 ubiquitin-protein ligase MARCHF2-like n=1 Tax=Homalodisca vitripennis TaxID=197043 RepID=UPI001EEA42F0|nr:E3 ubiquitin-protein ligase MARCHF2-like [Homalodisca vitripennis]
MNQMNSSVSCRICKSFSGNDLIKSPCLCKGSMGYVHFTCLERWLNQASRDSCELCHYRFNAVQSRRYSLLRSWYIWISNSTHRTYLCYDLLIALILTALTLAIVCLCLVGIGIFVTQEDRPSLKEPIVRGIIMFFLIMLMSSYMTTLYLILQDHVKPWYNWWRSCISVKLIISPDLVQPCLQVQDPPAQEIRSKEMLSLVQSDSCCSVCPVKPDKTFTDIIKPTSEIKVA